MNRFKLIFIIATVSGFFMLVYRNWFLTPEIIGGDWPYFFDEFIKSLPLFPPAWSSTAGNGLGGPIIAYNLDQYLYLTAQFTRIFSIPWPIIYKLLWFGLFLFLSTVSSGLLIRTLWPKARSWMIVVAVIIFSANSYIFMVIGGGQMGVALAYSIAPGVLTAFIKLIEKSIFNSQNFKFQISNFKFPMIVGLVLSVQIMFDPRIAYITLLIVVGYILIHAAKISKSVFPSVVVATGISGLLNSYWLLPILLTGATPIPEGFFSEQGFQFLSFADFSHAIGLLHPNWPENIFGKTYFLKPEFLALPILAFSALLFLDETKAQASTRKQILFFALIGLIGIFLSKGANPPFGEINMWIYNHIPGMYLFRDSTKFYLATALSYTILIPFTLTNIAKRSFGRIFLLCSFCFLFLLIHPALVGQLTGTFTPHEVPQEYKNLKDFLISQHTFYRTLWIPKQQRFTFVSNMHPSIEALPLYHATDSAQIINNIEKDEAKEFLAQLSIKYIIVPNDSLGEIFLNDKKYDIQARADLEQELDKISWLKKSKVGGITLYETPLHNDHFWLSNGGTLSYEMINSDDYKVAVNIDTVNTLYFSENFNPHWIAKKGTETIIPQKSKNNLMSFPLSEGEYSIEIFYAPKTYYFYGRIISIATLLTVVSMLCFVLQSEKHER